MPSRISQKVAVSVVFVAALFVSLLDSSIANVALPSIGREFAVAPTGIDGISIAYLVSLAVFIPASGWLGDRFGSKRVLLIALVGFTVASALCGLATSLTELVVFRALQGAAGGMLVPVGTAMLFRTFPPDERVRACAIIAIPTGLAPAIAPVLGGVLVTDASWRWVFFVNLPIGVAAGLFGALFVKEHTESDPGRFDVPGSLLSGVGLALVVYGVSDGPNAGWGSGQVLVSIVIGALLLTIMCVVELRTPAPIIPLRVFGNALFRKSTIVSVLLAVVFIGGLFDVTLYLQDGRGLTALNAGLSQFPNALGVIVGSQLGSRYVYWRLGPSRHTALGLAGVATCMGLFALRGAHDSLWSARLLLFGFGLSLGQVLVSNQAASFATITPRDTGLASTLYNACRQLGGAVGVALITTFIVIVGPVDLKGGHPVPGSQRLRRGLSGSGSFRPRRGAGCALHQRCRRGADDG